MKAKYDTFKVLPLRLSAASASKHELFIKEHSIRHHTDDKPAKRTLFVVNIPPYINEQYLTKAFSSAGSIHNVILQVKPSIKEDNQIENLGSFKSAYIIFNEPGSVKNALNFTSLELIPTSNNMVITGMKKWMKEYNKEICDRDKLEEEVNNFVLNFDKRKEMESKSETQLDDEGWTVVTSKSRKRGAARKESVKNKIKEKIAKQNKQKYLGDFYVFQKRESKMNNLVQMRKKYEEDKKRVAAMKQARKFKPY